jgi:hypothetical protein
MLPPLYPDEDERTEDAGPRPVGALVAASVVALASVMLLGALLLEGVH